MGGEGSIQGMIISLRNNKNLLRGRAKGFFRRELTYSQLRKYYRDSEKPIEDAISSQEQLRKIRARIIEDRKKETRKIIIVVSSLTIVLTFLIILLFNSFSFTEVNKSSTKKSRVVDYKMRNDSYNEMVELGLQHLNAEKYFLAVGNFENALRKRPNDLLAEVKLAEALCFLCSKKNIECIKANNYLDKLITKYPNKYLLKKLKASHVVNTDGFKP
ncbi:MAG: hypothetical protein RJQ00_03240 [Vicingaceae bacterium]